MAIKSRNTSKSWIPIILIQFVLMHAYLKKWGIGKPHFQEILYHLEGNFALQETKEIHKIL